MARVLILETDPVFAALLEDRLHVAGHRVQLFDEAAQAISKSASEPFDLVILAMELPVVPGIEVVRSLRSQPETQGIPILALSDSGTSGDRVTALKAGVDEMLMRPIDLEELTLRVDRLLGKSAARPSVLSGDLVDHSIWELVQYVQQGGKNGDLVVHGQRGSGRLQVREGKVVAARFQNLRGRNAVVALLDMKEGNFRLTTGELPEPEEEGERFPIPEALMQAAWLEDELKKRRDHLPATGMPLETLVTSAPVVEEEELAGLPMARIFEYVNANRGCRLYDLVEQIPEAPQCIRLAVAWLVEKEAIGRSRDATTNTVMNTKEISSSVVFDVAIHNLLAAAADAGLDTSDLPYLVLLDPPVWPSLKAHLESLPGFRRVEPLTKLVSQVDRRKGGSASFTTEVGTLSLHMQVMDSSMKVQIEGIVSVCAGVMLWLEGGEDFDMLRGIVERLEGSSAVGILVAPTEAGRATAERLTEGIQGWRVSEHAPRSLIGILRLLHPRTA